MPDALQVTRLMTNRRHNPIGIDGLPEFSWQFVGAAGQADYSVEVSDGERSVWSSGWVSGAAPFGVEYRGDPLVSRARYAWRVRLRGAEGVVSAWSDEATFETGLLSPADWSASWITAPRQPRFEGRVLYFRHEFDLPARVTKARVYASALGWYHLYLNGDHLTSGSLVPRWTPFDDYLEYQVFDAAPHLKPGTNTVGVVVADGRFRGRLGVLSKGARYGDDLAALAQLELELADGSSVTVCTDEAWSVGLGRVITADPKFGERVDLRISHTDWLRPGRELADPVRATTLATPRHLVAEEVERVTATATRGGVVTTAPSGAQLIDFGQNFAGVARLRLRGTAGQRVRIEYSEALTPEGELDTTYLLLNNRGGWFQRDEAILAGQQTDYQPAFTIHGFRYIAVHGLDEPLTDHDVEGVVISSDLTQIAEFSSSHQGLNQLWTNVLWSLRSNFMDTPTDCPTRERSGWTGDIQVFGPTAAQIVDCTNYLRRYLRNVAAEQCADGSLSAVIPAEDSPGRSRNPLRPTRTSVGWGDVTVLLPWTLYQYRGDVGVLRRQYQSAKAWVDQLAHRADSKRSLSRRLRQLPGDLEHYILDTGYHWGEWLRPGETMPRLILENLIVHHPEVATAYLAHSARTLANIATVLQEPEDVQRYMTLADSAALAWREAFVRESGGRIGTDRQDDYVRALAFDLLLPEQRPAALTRLVDLIEAKHHHLDTGFLSTPLLLPTLADAGRPDTAFRLLLQSTSPSWIHQVNLGATTTWETWEGYDDKGHAHESHNHYAFGAVARFLQEYVAGLRPAEPGYRRIRFAPLVGGGLSAASVSILTPYGPASSTWNLDGECVHLAVTIPPGATGDVELSDQRHNGLPPGTHHLTAAHTPARD